MCRAGFNGERPRALTPGPPQKRNKFHRFYWNICVFKMTKNYFVLLFVIENKKERTYCHNLNLLLLTGAFSEWIRLTPVHNSSARFKVPVNFTVNIIAFLGSDAVWLGTCFLRTSFLLWRWRLDTSPKLWQSCQTTRRHILYNCITDNFIQLWSNILKWLFQSCC